MTSNHRSPCRYLVCRLLLEKRLATAARRTERRGAARFDPCPVPPVGGRLPARTYPSPVRRPMMGQVAYRSKVSIERERGPLRSAHLPAESDPVAFGVHAEVAEHYGVTPDQSPPH